ncbi:armadillo/beta-catenin/plakoglobin [Gloeophyllum trabeum ATCC 11539]|uniref:Uridine kinase n=1 Tax=Gloeophyllum trabeum (strain ATCC 11539 / FP-39264 / Madison 617) TaxID=670483 RepID=S7Q448_GLOTA|nr:armadillo/beta-catenin/plakoglobin [Gloeophyllum trabeum ATCC 11539]EPQ54243.1 armadillo/beta-catenin/plakoglobin [Gloeophyllum trabeum ATCC 11539]
MNDDSGDEYPDAPLDGGNFGSLPTSTTIQALKNTVLKSHGRPPWYGEDGQPISDAFLIGIAGGSASGKTHVARQIVQSLGSIPTVVILSQDSFYKRHTPEEVALAMDNKYDFDHPSALDMPMFAQCLMDLKKCRQTNVPVYSFTEHQRLDETQYLYGAAIVIAEGIMALQDPALRALYDLKIFVQCDSDLMLARRIRRDVKERGRSVDGILDQYLRYVKPAYDNFVFPTSRYADIIVPGSDNHVAIELISTHIRRQLHERARRFRPKMVSRRPTGLSPPSTVMSNVSDRHPNLILLPQTPQLQGIYTILRDETTSKQDFIFFVDRLATLLIEAAVELLPFRPKSVETPCGVETPGKELDAGNVCGVTILRSGGPLERGLQRVINDALLGSLLVQTDSATAEPLLLHVMLPVCIRDRAQAKDTWAFLLDAQIGTAASAFMAIRVLLDHGVRQDHIVFITFLVARDGGISTLRRAFPEVRIVTGAVDANLRELWIEEPANESDTLVRRRKVWVIEPGMGQIGDRYYL